MPVCCIDFFGHAEQQQQQPELSYGGKFTDDILEIAVSTMPRNVEAGCSMGAKASSWY
jgi:hypothetical protein